MSCETHCGGEYSERTRTVWRLLFVRPRVEAELVVEELEEEAEAWCAGGAEVHAAPAPREMPEYSRRPSMYVLCLIKAEEKGERKAFEWCRMLQLSLVSLRVIRRRSPLWPFLIVQDFRSTAY